MKIINLKKFILTTVLGLVTASAVGCVVAERPYDYGSYRGTYYYSRPYYYPYRYYGNRDYYRWQRDHDRWDRD